MIALRRGPTLVPVRTTRLKIALRDVTPPVVRVVDVPSGATLPELHDLLQAAVGWTDSHLHQFVAGETRYGVPDEDDWDDQQDEAGVRLQDLPDRFTYLYDFGDGWKHDVEVLGRGGEEPGCRYGEGRCPPEDCGGPHGYAELLEALADPSHPEHEDMRRWAGPLSDFDQADTDRLVRQTVGTVPDSVRLVLDLTAEGVKLTPGGRLPRVFVRQVQEQRPHWHLLGRPAQVEEDLLPLAALHGVLRDAGLLRLSKGTLRPTRAAGDDLEVVRRLRSWFQADPYGSWLASVAVADLAANGPRRMDALAAVVRERMGRGWVSDGRPLTEADVRATISRFTPVFRGLDLVDVEWPMLRAGSSARTLIPRVTALAHLWSTPDRRR